VLPTGTATSLLDLVVPQVRTRHKVRVIAVQMQVTAHVFLPAKMPTLASVLPDKMQTAVDVPSGITRIGGRASAETTPAEAGAPREAVIQLHKPDKLCAPRSN
jgi:hypothetical protein